MIVRVASDLTVDEQVLVDETRTRIASDAEMRALDATIVFGARDPYQVRLDDPRPRILVLMARREHLGEIEAAQARIADVLVLLSPAEARACRASGIAQTPGVLCDTRSSGPLAPASPLDRIATARVLAESSALTSALGPAGDTAIAPEAIDSVVRAIREAVVLAGSE